VKLSRTPSSQRNFSNGLVGKSKEKKRKENAAFLKIKLLLEKFQTLTTHLLLFWIQTLQRKQKLKA
jgi:hypothetical protein